MSQNKHIQYAGVDVSKATLDLYFCGTRRSVKNQPAGHRELLDLLGAQEGPVQVIMEATGGYEDALVRALHAGGIALSVVQPGRVRHYAKALNRLAKNDRIDAQVIAEFGSTVTPAPTPAQSPQAQRLCEVITRREQLIAARVAQENQSEHYVDKDTLAQARKLIALLKKQIAQCEEKMAGIIHADEVMNARKAALEQVPGVGEITSATLIGYMPELGVLSAGAAAALAGVAPYDNESGRWKGRRTIRGGRANVRTALYMAALSAVRHDPIMRAHYQNLRKRGKPAKVAITVAMRKLITLLNRLLKNPNFKLRRQSPKPQPPCSPKTPAAASGAGFGGAQPPSPRN